jgi:hypothetical protein
MSGSSPAPSSKAAEIGLGRRLENEPGQQHQEHELRRDREREVRQERGDGQAEQDEGHRVGVPKRRATSATTTAAANSPVNSSIETTVASPATPSSCPGGRPARLTHADD